MGTNYLYALMMPVLYWVVGGGDLFHLRDRSNNRALHQIRASLHTTNPIFDSYLHLAWNLCPY